MSEGQPQYLWYLAYGSNMNNDTLVKRRKVKPIKSFACKVPGWRLAFNLRGAPYFEPAFASIVPYEQFKAPGVMELQGVAHYITKEQYEQIRKTEGGGGHDKFGYQDQIVSCFCYGKPFYHLENGETEQKEEDVPVDDMQIEATTLIVHQYGKVDHYYPSERYWNIIVKGATHYKLDALYLQFLKNHPHYSAKKMLFGQKLGRIVFLATNLPIFVLAILLVLIPRTLKLNPQGYVSFVANWVLEKAQSFAWFLHDTVISKIFGPGDRM